MYRQTQDKNNCVSPGPLNIEAPLSDYYLLKPQRFAEGLKEDGRIIGSNVHIPNPCEPSTNYHKTRFFRGPHWLENKVLTPTEAKLYTAEDIVRLREERRRRTQQMDLGPSEGTLETELIAENDPEFNETKARKRKERELQEERQAYMRLIPPEIKNIPGHFGPTTTQTQSEVIGQYLDLCPKLPAVYPSPETPLSPQPMSLKIRYRKSNFSDHPLIPDHSFAVDPREMLTPKGCYTRGMEGSLYRARNCKDADPDTVTTFRRNAMNLGTIVGERKKGFTWPLYSTTGLELNRPVTQCVSILASRPGSDENPLRVDVRAKEVPFIYNKYHTAIGETRSPEEVPLEPVPVVCRPQKKWCHPHNRRVGLYKDHKCDPCHLDFINTQTLPKPIGF